jgi:hypothetical protein
LAELWAELEPKPGGLRSLVDSSRTLLKCFHSLDIPDQPLGSRYPSPLIAAALSQHVGGDRIVAHVRTVDYAPHALRAVIKGLHDVGVRRVVLLRGDPLGPEVGLKPEDALDSLSKYRARFGVKMGLIISMRRSVEEIRRRLSRAPDFVLVLNLTVGRVEALSRLKREFGVKAYSYMLVNPGSRELPGVTTLRLRLDEALTLAREALAREAVDGFIVSSPGDDELKMRLCEELRGL